MQTLQSMQLSKKEMKEVKGARWIVGDNTSAYGDGSNGATTYLDGMNIGHDASSGSLAGDSWAYFRTAVEPQAGVLKLTSRK
ncbi:MAG: hypothetical protein NTW29_02790 [Bacteroidetes bacterium]|nr:hypothetical protein [Bacteroidota bacterium]